MKNFVQPGDYGVPVLVPNAVTSGQLVIIHAIVGVAATDGAANSVVSLAMEGIFDLAKNPPDVLTLGQVAMVTPATGIVGVAGTAAIGVVVQAAAAGSTTARVRPTPSVAGTPTTAESMRHPVREPEHEHAGKVRH